MPTIFDGISQVLKLFDLNGRDCSHQFVVPTRRPSDLVLQVAMNSPFYGLGASQNSFAAHSGRQKPENSAADRPYPHQPAGLASPGRHQGAEGGAVISLVLARVAKKWKQVWRKQTSCEYLSAVDVNGPVLATMVHPQNSCGDRGFQSVAQDRRLSTKSTLALRISASAPNRSRWPRA